MLLKICQMFLNVFCKISFPGVFFFPYVCVPMCCGWLRDLSYGWVDSSPATVSGGLLEEHSGSHDCNNLQQLVPSDFLIFKNFSPAQEFC